MASIIIVVIVILVSGALGGLMNSFLSQPEKDRLLPWWQHVVVGIGAALIIPLFLNSISANVIEDIVGTSTNPGNPSKLLVLAGFCVLAATVSRSFINSFSNKVFQELRDVKETAGVAKNTAGEAKIEADKAVRFQETLVEPDLPEVEKMEMDVGSKGEASILSSSELAVLKSMFESQFPMRSLTGLQRDSGVSFVELNQIIASMLQKDLIKQSESSKGQPRWYPTSRGRVLYMRGRQGDAPP